MSSAKSLISRIGGAGLSRADPGRLALFRNTIGKHLNDDEINQAVEWCEVYKANPFLKDIYFFVFDAGDKKKRRMVPVLSIAMYRKIAARSGDYRPDEAPPRFTYDERLIGPANPRGIVDCEVSVFRFSHGSWFPITERVRWDERAPLKDHCPDGWRVVETGGVWEDTGRAKTKRVPRGDVVKILDPAKEAWLKMPETMIAKCSEASVIRKGWPEETAGTYGEGELDAAATIEATAIEVLDEYETERRLSTLGSKDALTVQWQSNGPLERVPIGQFADRVLAWASDPARTANDLAAWWAINAVARAEFHARQGADYLDLHASFERIHNRLNKDSTTKPSTKG